MQWSTTHRSVPHMSSMSSSSEQCYCCFEAHEAGPRLSYRSTGNSLSPIISSGMRCHYKLVGADTELNEPDIVFCVIQDVTWTSIRCRLCSQQCFHFSILEFPKAIFLSTLTSIPPQLVLVRSATKEIRGAIGTSSRHSKLAFDSLIAAPAIV